MKFDPSAPEVLADLGRYEVRERVLLHLIDHPDELRDAGLTTFVCYADLLTGEARGSALALAAVGRWYHGDFGGAVRLGTRANESGESVLGSLVVNAAEAGIVADLIVRIAEGERSEILSAYESYRQESGKVTT